MSLYLSGTAPGPASAGIERKRPVIGGDSFSSLAMCATVAERLPPAEIPMHELTTGCWARRWNFYTSDDESLVQIRVEVRRVSSSLLAH